MNPSLILPAIANALEAAAPTILIGVEHDEVGISEPCIIIASEEGPLLNIELGRPHDSLWCHEEPFLRYMRVCAKCSKDELNNLSHMLGLLGDHKERFYQVADPELIPKLIVVVRTAWDEYSLAMPVIETRNCACTLWRFPSDLRRMCPANRIDRGDREFTSCLCRRHPALGSACQPCSFLGGKRAHSYYDIYYGGRS